MNGSNPVVALTGPTHAEEVARGIPTAIVAASESRAAAELTQAAFMNDTNFRVYTSSDIIAVSWAVRSRTLSHSAPVFRMVWVWATTPRRRS